MRGGRYAVTVDAIPPVPVPLVRGADGIIRVEGTRIPLQTVVVAFDSGVTAEEIAHQYPTLSLPAVYATIAWILQHRDFVAECIAEREPARARVRAEAERRFPPDGIRARLRARMK